MTDVHDAVTAYKFPSVLFFSFLNLFSFFFFNYLRHFYRKKKKKNTQVKGTRTREKERKKDFFSALFYLFHSGPTQPQKRAVDTAYANILEIECQRKQPTRVFGCGAVAKLQIYWMRV